MRKMLLILAGAAVVLTGCGGQAATPRPSAVPSTPTAAAVTVAPPPAAPVGPSEFKLDPATACKSVDEKPEPVPGIPPAGPEDQSRGAANASVVLMEYGDYQ